MNIPEDRIESFLAALILDEEVSIPAITRSILKALHKGGLVPPLIDPLLQGFFSFNAADLKELKGEKKEERS